MLLHQGPDALVVKNAAGRVEHWNDAAVVIFGYTAAEAVGQPLAELIVPKDGLDDAARHDREAEARPLGLRVGAPAQGRLAGAREHLGEGDR